MGNGRVSSGSWKMIINILLVILGIVFIAEPRGALVGVTITLGILLVIYGAIMISRSEIQKAQGMGHDSIVMPIIWLACGILLLVFAHGVAAWLLPLVVGAWMILLGVMNLRSARQGGFSGKSGSFATVLAVGEIILGVLSICSMATSGTALGIMIGICMLVYGVCSIISWATNYVSGRRL